MLTPLGSLGSYTKAFGINNKGQVVGGSALATGAEHAFITEPNGVGIRDLGVFGGNFSRATAINSSGQVVGTSTTGEGEYPPPFGVFSPDYHAFITGPNGTGMRDIGVLVISDLGQLFANISSNATGINDAGQVIGTFSARYGTSGSFITGPNGVGMTRLRDANNNLVNPLDINNAGWVVAGGPESGFSLIGPHGVDGIPLSGSGYAINDVLQVAGSFPVGSEVHAFLTGPNGTGMRDLGAFDGNFSVATDVNSAGQVVGYYSGPYTNQHHAYVTGPNGEDITDLSSIPLPNGDHLHEAMGINDRGQIIANSSNNAYLLTPVPESASYALMLAGLGLVGFVIHVRNRRIYGLAARFSTRTTYYPEMSGSVTRSIDSLVKSSTMVNPLMRLP